MVTYAPKQTKTILNKMKNIDSWFWCRYSLNPYNGCEHACIYCDGRSQKYYIHKDFEDKIYYKPHAAEMLENRIKNARSLLPDIIATGGTCDAYQPAETKYKRTQSILEILKKYKWPIGISTKNILIKRDLSLLNEIGKQTYSAVNFSVSTPDENIAHYFEPGASPPSERFKLIKHIRDNYPNIYVGINYMPIIPLIEDTSEQIQGVVEQAHKYGAQYIIFAPHLTLREGNQKNFFLGKLKEYCENQIKKPHLYQKFLKEYVGDYKSVTLYLKRKSEEIAGLCNKYSIPIRAPRWYPNDFRDQNYRAAEKLLNLHYYNQINGIKKQKFLWAGFEIQNLDVSVGQLVVENRLNTLKNMDSEIFSIINPYIKKPSTLDSFL